MQTHTGSRAWLVAMLTVGIIVAVGVPAVRVLAAWNRVERIEFDPDMPDGTPRKLLDVSRLEALGWTAQIPLDQGIERTREWMVEHWNEISA